MLKWNRYILPTLMISMVMWISISTQISAATQKKSGSEITNTVFLPTLLTPYSPLFEGFSARWDGTGYLHWDINYVIGSHIVRDIFSAEGDVGEVSNLLWYDPDPLDLGPEIWTSYYSLSTGRFLSSSSTGSPYWKWGYDWIVPYEFQFFNGQIVKISSQNFLVTGPHSGFTTFGMPVQYWELINQERFLIWDDGGAWKQYVLQGDAVLRYDAGITKLLIHSDVKRTDYYEGEITQYTVHYIDNLSRSNSWSGLAQTEVFESLDRPSNNDSSGHTDAKHEHTSSPFNQEFSIRMPDDY